MSALITEETRKIIQDVVDFCNSENVVVALTITNEDEYTRSGILIKQLKDYKKTIEGKKDVEVKPLYDTYKSALDEMDAPVKIIQEKINTIESAGREYRRLDEIRRAEEQKQLDDQAEAERRELENRAGTNQEKAQALRKKAQELRAQADVETDVEKRARLINEAAKYDNRAVRYEIKAEEKIEQAAVTVAPVIAPTLPKNTRGAFNTRVYYKARITSKARFIAWVVANQQYNLVDENMSILNKMAGPSKSTIDGVEFYQV